LIGRRLAFNLTLGIAGIFGVASGAAPNFAGLAVMFALIGFGVGGNRMLTSPSSTKQLLICTVVPVDSAVFLEFLPGTHQYLLEILSVWWSFGQIIPAGVAWGFLPNFSCAADTPAGECRRADNMGWRYLLYTNGAITLVAFFARFFFFHLHESPKYLIGKGRYQEAVNTLNAVAKYNGTTQPVTVEDFERIERELGSPTDDHEGLKRKTAFQRMIANFTTEGGIKHVKALFSSKKQAFSMTLIILIWGMIGLGSPLYSNFLPQYLANHGAQSGSDSINITYRNNLIIVACSVPGTILGGWLITLPVIGRRGTLGLSLILTAVFLFAFTTARSQASILAFNCVATFVQYM
jgi:MFS family permease